MVCSECGEPLAAKEVHTHPGPGAARILPFAEGRKGRPGNRASKPPRPLSRLPSVEAPHSDPAKRRRNSIFWILPVAP